MSLHKQGDVSQGTPNTARRAKTSRDVKPSTMVRSRHFLTGTFASSMTYRPPKPSVPTVSSYFHAGHSEITICLICKNIIDNLLSGRDRFAFCSEGHKYRTDRCVPNSLMNPGAPFLCLLADVPELLSLIQNLSEMCQLDTEHCVRGCQKS